VAAPFLIRPARLSDDAEISRLTIELGYPCTTAQISSRLTALLLASDYFIAVAVTSEPHLLGWIGVAQRLLLHYDARGELFGLVVGSGARRQGIGKALVRTAEEWAVTRHLNAICVRSNAARAESHPFYESAGYRRNKTQHFYVKELAGRCGSPTR